MQNFRVSQVSVSDGHTAILTSDSKLFCFGRNTFGESGDQSLETRILVDISL